MIWLITGGCGFIGANLVSHLLREKVLGIRVVDDLSVGYLKNLEKIAEVSTVSVDQASKSIPTGLEFVQADIKDLEAVKKVAHGVDVIVHLAANTGVAPSVENPVFDCLQNVVGTLNCLESARVNAIKKFVFASSGAPVGEVTPPIHEKIAPKPVSPYGASKLAGEGYCSSYYRCFGVETVALRFGNVYGPGSDQKESVVAKFIKKAMAGEKLEVYGDGHQTRDFVYIDDLINAIKLAATVPDVGGEIFQIATNSETTVVELIEIMIKRFEVSGLDVPEVIHSESRLGDVRRNFSDTSKAKKMLGWSPETGLDNGIGKTLQYFLGVQNKENV